jgi:hypothetical protein
MMLLIRASSHIGHLQGGHLRRNAFIINIINVNIIIKNIITLVNVFMRKVISLQMAQGPKHIAGASQKNQ